MTKRDYSYSVDDFCDLGLAFCILFWVFKYANWSDVEVDGDGQFYETAHDRYTWTVVNKDRNNEFKIMPFLAVMVVILWLRFILMLQLTRKFGPMLRILINMVSDVLKFLLIWTLFIIMITSVASLLFGELADFKKFASVGFLMFGTGMGNYNLALYNDLSLGKVFGEAFVIISVIINNVVLLNFVIAIQADTYSRFSEESLGIYYDGIITRIPIYEDDMHYGGLIVGTPPFNVLGIIMIPFYWCVRDERKLRRCNDIITKIMFSPIAIIVTILFIVLNMCLLPFAYIMAIITKIKILRNKNAFKDSIIGFAMN